jgi:aspartyl-tRNA(Asn)/glutamyl-tRNA(Gln) amidotransferase subunit A
VHVFENEAVQRAKKLDLQRASGSPMRRLHGVVIGIKDVLCYKDHPVTAASAILGGFESIYSATAIQRLIDEDAIIIGTLNCDEFAMGSTNEYSVYGRTLNPIDESRVPGGSSGGSAAALAAGLCMASLGSDTGGSVRQPADFCGIIGLKPGYGRISRYGLIAYASSFDQVGIFAQTIPDCALLLEIMAGPDEYDSTVTQQAPPLYTTQLDTDRKFRFAYFKEALDHPGLDPVIAEALRNTIERLKKDGHEAAPVEFDLLEYMVPAYYVLTTAEASSNLSRYDGMRFGKAFTSDEKELTEIGLTEFYKRTRSKGFDREVKRRIMLGTFVLSAGYYDAYFTRAQRVRKKLYDKTQLIFSSFDAILLPTSPVTAFKVGEKLNDPLAMYLADIYTVMANLTGISAISLPLFRHPSGMPFGLQVMTNRLDELTLLQVSQQLMRYRIV